MSLPERSPQAADDPFATRFAYGRDLRSVIGGLIAVGLGWMAIAEGGRHPVGSFLRMGPGYFPILLGILLAGLGFALVLFGVFRPGTPAKEAFIWRPVVMVGLSIACFALMIPRLGFVPATFAIVFVASLSERKIALRSVLLLAAGMSVAVWLVFSIILGVPNAIILG